MAAGAAFVSGEIVDGRLALSRSDNATFTLAGLLMCLGLFVDNGDGTVDVTFPE